MNALEVLRGQQRTVLGQNSDGDAINVTTVRPQLGVYSGTTDLSAGSDDYDRFHIAGNFLLCDTAAVRVVVQQEAHRQPPRLRVRPVGRWLGIVGHLVSGGGQK